MRYKGLVSGLGLAMLWLGQAELLWAVESQEFDVNPTAPSQALERVSDVTELEQLVIHCLIIELRGKNIHQALGHAGFSESAAGSRYISAAKGDEVPDSEKLNAMLKTLAEDAEVQILSRPMIRSIMGQSAEVFVGSQKVQIPYLVRTGPKLFELREVAVYPSLGLSIQLTPRAGGTPDQIEISPLTISMTTFDSREPIPGLDLDVGKPIISKRTLETSITLEESTEVNGIALPGPPGRQPVLFLKVRRVKATPESFSVGVKR